MAGRPKTTLTMEQQLELCRWIAEYQKPTDIIAYFQTTHGKRLSLQTVYTYTKLPKWQSTIAQYRQAFTKDIMAVPISQKRVRLERLEKLYQRALSAGDASPEARKEARDILGAARQEMEESGTRINAIAVTNHWGDLTTQELQVKRQEVLQQIKTLGGTTEVSDAPASGS